MSSEIPLLRQKNDLINTKHFAIKANSMRGNSKVSMTKHVLDGLSTSVMTLLTMIQRERPQVDFYLTICHDSLSPKNVMLGNFSFNENSPEDVLKVFLERLQSLINRNITKMHKYLRHFSQNEKHLRASSFYSVNRNKSAECSTYIICAF